jgi:hypothetical protein
MILKPIRKSRCKPFINFDITILLLQLFLAQPAMPQKTLNQKTATKKGSFQHNKMHTMVSTKEMTYSMYGKTSGLILSTYQTILS